MTTEHRWIIPPPPRPSLPVASSADHFAVRRIYCVGRNYAAHAREMGDAERKPPFFFSKPADAVLHGDGAVAYPPLTEELHHEVELVVALGAGGPVSRDTAQSLVFGYTVGVDLTRRDLQATAKSAGRPWDMAKGFDESAPCAPLVTAAEVGHPIRGGIDLWVGDRHAQSGDLSEMIWSVPEIIVELSRYVRLRAGDLIFTGTPAGVGPLRVGDRVRARVQDIAELSFDIVAP